MSSSRNRNPYGITQEHVPCKQLFKRPRPHVWTNRSDDWSLCVGKLRTDAVRTRWRIDDVENSAKTTTQT